MKQKIGRIKGRTRQYHYYFGDFNILLSAISRTGQKRISKDIEYHFDLLDIHRTSQPIVAEFTFFLNAQGTFTKIIF